MLGHARKREIALNWSFYCTLPNSGALDEQARKLGAIVIHTPVSIGDKWNFVRAMRQSLCRLRYDVLHCHHDLMSSAYLAAAAGLRMRQRIVHVHNADERLPTPSRVKQRILREPMRRICLSAADRIIGISDHTLDTFLAGRPRRPGRDVVHYYGVDSTPFATGGDRSGFRRTLGLASDALILLFAGRMVPEKNPIFVVDVLAELRQLEPRAVAVFAGAGSQERSISKRATMLGVHESVRQLGWRDDISDIMSCCDWFILPRPETPMEGFGLAVVEAQLAGLRLLLSRGIADDPLLPTAGFRRLKLASSPAQWARAALDLLNGPQPSRADTRSALAQSPMDMDRALNDLLQLYR
ncbi:MAG: glycosyltransferase [Hyphomicrobiaceae bacterium]|nr:glycosyltransferase [Hyphomicrobiaceae bacterium]